MVLRRLLKLGQGSNDAAAFMANMMLPEWSIKMICFVLHRNFSIKTDQKVLYSRVLCPFIS